MIIDLIKNKFLLEQVFLKINVYEMDTSQYFYFRTQKRRTFKFSFKISLAEIFGLAN